MREVYRRERIPARVRWWLAASGMRDWYRNVASELRADLGAGAKPVMAELIGLTFERRYAALREVHAHLPPPDRDGRAIARTMGGLYRIGHRDRGAWIFDAVGGAPRGVREQVAAQRLIAPLDPGARWEEVTVHLGEWLIVLTEELPARLPRARPIVADICFRAGARFGESVKKQFGMTGERDPAADAIEVLRMTEYLFRVNPHHWGDTDPSARSGYLEGTACPWYTRPGWDRMHCGIFGQFQAGISSVFGLRYHLTKTIPKHGGTTCRVDLEPIRIRASKDAPAGVP